MVNGDYWLEGLPQRTPHRFRPSAYYEVDLPLPNKKPRALEVAGGRNLSAATNFGNLLLRVGLDAGQQAPTNEVVRGWQYWRGPHRDNAVRSHLRSGGVVVDAAFKYFRWDKVVVSGRLEINGESEMLEVRTQEDSAQAMWLPDFAAPHEKRLLSNKRPRVLARIFDEATTRAAGGLADGSMVADVTIAPVDLP